MAENKNSRNKWDLIPPQRQRSGGPQDLPSACRSSPAGTPAPQLVRQGCFCDAPLNTLSFWRVSLKPRTLKRRDRISNPSSASHLLGELGNPFIFLDLHCLRWRSIGPVTLVATALLRGECESKHRCKYILKSEAHFPGQNVIIHLTDGGRRRGLMPHRAYQLKPPLIIILWSALTALAFALGSPTLARAFICQLRPVWLGFHKKWIKQTTPNPQSLTDNKSKALGNSFFFPF